MSPVQEHHDRSDYLFMISTQARRTIRYRRSPLDLIHLYPCFLYHVFPSRAGWSRFPIFLTFMKSQRQIIGRAIKCYTMWRKGSYQEILQYLILVIVLSHHMCSWIAIICGHWSWSEQHSSTWADYKIASADLLWGPSTRFEEEGWEKSPAFGRAGFNCFLHVCCCFAFSFDARLAEASAFNSTSWNHRRSVWNDSGDFSGSQNYSMREHGSHLKQENEKRTKRERA